MKNKIELLAPAGNRDAAIAAISNGADAIYLGLSSFSARAYAANFNYDNLKEIVNYAHLRMVNVYVTMNTILYENEIEEALTAVDEIAEIGVDAVIVQDLALVSYINTYYPSLEVHISTQVGIDDLEGIVTMESIGAKRVVLAREVNLEKIKHIKEFSNMPLEVFGHGALCVSYSGNCLMSGLIGMRSGNRGRCVGACRKLYSLCDVTNNHPFEKTYLLSTKDLKTIDRLDDLLPYVSSLKIEGRMRDASYVACVVSNYRSVLDHKKSILEANDELKRTFHRTYTKGYLFNESPKDIVNINKPNNYGYLVGEVQKINKDRVWIKVYDGNVVSQGDQIRIDAKEEINIPVNLIYDANNNLINASSSIFALSLKERVAKGDKVYITKDKKYLEEIGKSYPKEFKRLPLSFAIEGKINEGITLTAPFNEYRLTAHRNSLDEARTAPTSYDDVVKQLRKLGDTPYIFDSLRMNLPSNAFINVKTLNDLRRECIEKINNERLQKYVKKKVNNNNTNNNATLFISPESPLKLVVYATTKEQYDACIEAGIAAEDIYYDGSLKNDEIVENLSNVIHRNNAIYDNKNQILLVGGMGSFTAYKDSSKFIITDTSFNVTNSKTLYELYKLGASSVTISHELNKKQIAAMLDAFNKNYGFYPNVEMVVYGRQNLMVTKYCPLLKMGLCGTCKTTRYELRDDYSYFPILFHRDCNITILNGKILNLLDNIDELNHISRFRLQFTTETGREVKEIISNAKKALTMRTKTFNEKTNTRGHFNREIL